MEDEVDLETLEDLENSIRTRYENVSSLLADRQRIPSRCDYKLTHFIDEFTYWEERQMDLEFSMALLLEKEVLETVEILNKHDSVYVTLFKNLMDRLIKSIIKARSNLSYLQILKQQCLELYDVKSLNDLLPILPDLFSKFIFIFEESDYYNTTFYFDLLCKYLGNQIIFLCRKTIDMTTALDSNVEVLLNLIHSCLQCCEIFLLEYNEVVRVYNNCDKEKLTVKSKNILMFMDRCKNLKFILKAKIVFKRLQVHRLMVSKPKFSFAPGVNHETSLEMIEFRFDNMINKLKEPIITLFDVMSADWFYHNEMFLNELRRLCWKIEQLTDKVLNASANKIDRMNVLQSLHYFSSWPQLKSYFQNKVEKLYDSIIEEITVAKEWITYNEHQIYALMPKYSGVCLLFTARFKRITMLKNMIADRPWLFGSSIAQEFRKSYESYAEVHERIVSHINKKWWNLINPEIEDQLSHNVLLEYIMPNGLSTFSVNLTSDVYGLIWEIILWQLMKIKVPYELDNFAENSPKVKILYRNVAVVVKNYNRIIAGLSNQEKLLFVQTMMICAQTLKPLVTKYTWSQIDAVNAYVTECYNILEMAQDIRNNYTLCNIEIMRICERMANTLLFSTKNCLQIEDLNKDYDQQRTKTFRNNIIDCYNEIIKYMTVVYEGFENHINHIISHWEHYVNEIDILVSESLILNVQWSLENILKRLSSPRILITVSLNHNRVKYSPSIAQLIVRSMGSHSDMLIALKILPRLRQTFKLTNIYMMLYSYAVSNNKMCHDLQLKINQTIKYVLGKIKSRMSILMEYSKIWTVDKETYFKTLQANKHNAAEFFDMKITEYSEYIESVKLIPPQLEASCTIIQTDLMIAQIIRQCHEWIFRFSQQLLDETEYLMNDFYEYIDVNISRVMMPPENPIEIIEYTEYQKKLVLECDTKFKDINSISDNVLVIEKHKIKMPKIMNSMYTNVSNTWEKYKKILSEAKVMLNDKQEEFKKLLLHQQEKLKKDAKQFFEEFIKSCPTSVEWKPKDATDYLKKTEQKYLQKISKEKKLESDLALFNLEYTSSPDLILLKKELDLLEQVWKIITEWDVAWNLFKTDSFWKINLLEMETTVQRIYKKLSAFLKLLRDKNWSIIEITRNNLDAFKRVLPLITDLKNPAMKTRHWDEVREVIDNNFDEMDPGFTLEKIIEMQMQKYAEAISEVSNKATMELAIENTLKSIKHIWENVMKLKVEPYNSEGIYQVKASDEITQMLEDHLLQIASMKGSRYVFIFFNEVEFWEKGLGLVTEVLELMLFVQRQYVNLNNIFKTEDARKKMPDETKLYEKIHDEWKALTIKMYETQNVFKSCGSKDLLKQLQKMNEKLAEIQRALELYMESKRNKFPRFYFISNEDLLEMLGNSHNLQLLQPHFKKCFDNIYEVEFNYANGLALGMYSADGEYVPWTRSVRCMNVGSVENWFSLIEKEMRSTLKNEFKNVNDSLMKSLQTRDEWIMKWPGQLCITASQIQWTASCTNALIQSKTSENNEPLKNILEKQESILSTFSNTIRGNLQKIDRLKIVALVTIEIHARDVIDKMYKSNCTDVSDFEWISQLRFYWDPLLDEISIRQTNTKNLYGYEYLGNSGRLVITPLTDRCYITLTTALHLFRGGSPKGPAGTGKTETVKDLGKNLAYYVIIINCSEGLDYKSMGRMFSGLAQQGAWGCFDEFNRINIEVLSVVSQQILSIYSALASGLTKFMFERSKIRLVSTCGIFITMNPGYAGRTELPDNLKSMFRAISMMVPDSKLIAEITLFGEGFKDTRNFANKVYVLFSLCQQQLSKQNHYDFGLRGLVSLLRYAGLCRRQYSHMPEDQVLLLAMRNMNFAKLTVDDLPLFMGIMHDLFPTTNLPEVKDNVLIDAIKRHMIEKNRQPSDAAVTKIVQLYETKVSRHSVMILGQTGAAKTATWKTLKGAMNVLKLDNIDGFETVITYPLNPKAITMGELYGEYNLSTQEWMDGVLSSIMRKVCSDSEAKEKWILFDGPVDAVWIENMNSVMDDNKVLTLINSERITMPKQVSLLFEVEDLAEASPATVSRCGIIYNDYKDFGWKLYVDSWLNNYKFEPFKLSIKKHFDKYIDPILEFKKFNCIETVPLPELSSIVSLCKLLEHFMFGNLTIEIPVGMNIDNYEFLVKIWFLFCMVWSVCAVVNETGRKKIDTFLREWENVFPTNDTVYHYYVDMKTGKFSHWESFLQENQWTYDPELPFFKIIVPTVDTVRYNYLLEAFLIKKQPVLLVGPVGTGKTSAIHKVLEALDKNLFSQLTINMSAQTTSKNVQETIEGRLEKRTKELYVPLANKTLVTFLDDMNMPMKEVYGAQPPLELVRQWIDYGFWYDRQNQHPKHVKNMLLVGAMGPPGGGRNTISNRLLSSFSMINLTFPEETQISQIYGSMLSQHLTPFDENIRDLKSGLTEMTISLYKIVEANLLPTPAKMHYLFNLRDISKVFQGLLRSSTDCQKTNESMLRLWCHEVFRVFNDKLIDEKDREWFLIQINNELGKHYDVTYSSLCISSEQNPIFCDFLNKHSLYEEVSDEKYLREFIDNALNEYNSSVGVIPMNLVLFRDAIDHICRIVRVISQPRGYILLVGVGGFGRSSLARVANWLCDYNLFTIQLTKSYNTPDFKEDLKGLYYKTGVKDQPTTFLFNDNQIVNESFLEIINNILSTGEVSKLYKEEEFDEIRNTLADILKRSGLSVIETTDSIYSIFLDRVRSNLHIILCLSPIGNKFRTRLRQYPSLVSCTTIDWFLDWPKEALLEVAFKSISNLEILETITGSSRVNDINEEPITEEELKRSIANMFAIIHNSVIKYSNTMIVEMKRHSYVTPTNYLELVSGYKELLRLKRIEVANTANKLRNGLFKIDDTREKVAGMTIELEKATESVNSYTKECDSFLEMISKQTSETDKKKVEVDEENIRIKEEEIVCQQLYSTALADLETAMPALEEAIDALNALNKKDLAEVKSFSRPPERVKLVLEAVMILKESEPSWAEAKRQLGDPNFLIQLKDFDKDHISAKVLKKIATFTRNPEFEPEKVGEQSMAAKSLAMWVIAIEKYARIYKIVAPKKASADAALASLEEKQLALSSAQENLLQLQELLENLNNDFNQKMAEKEQLIKKAQSLTRNLERAATLIEGLSGERLRWTETVKQLDIEFDYLPGDCLLSIAFISYTGPFVSKYRDILMKLWTKSIRDMKIPNNSKYEIKAFLSDPATIRNWNINGLPNDDFSTENGIIINRSSRWPLVIDPQLQALKWIKKTEHDNGLIIVDFCLPDYMQILEKSLEKGYPTLLQITSEDIDPAIMPILSKSVVKKGNQIYIQMADRLLPYDNNFRFFITTKLRNPHYPPEIFTRTTVVNFNIKEEGLEDQLLDIVIGLEKPALKTLKDSLVININKGKKTLVELENELLRLLNEIEGSLLENEELFQTLGSSKVTSAAVNEQIESSLITQAEIDIAREGYRDCAKRASILFFILNELNLIDPMYQFSLDSYTYLFENSIKNSEKDDYLDRRIIYMNNYHTYAVYKNTCRGLFEIHKLLFSFQICVSILIAGGLIPVREFEFILKGGIVLNKEEQADNPCSSWLPSSNWDNITELDKMPVFHGIEKSFQQLSRDWKSWYMSPDPENIKLPGRWKEICNSFQKLIIVRCLRLDRLSFAILNFITDKLGAKFVEPPVMDVKSAFEDSSNKTPLIFLLSPGVDPSSTLISLASHYNQREAFQTLSLGQGQAPIATQMIELGQTNGNWVYLANCHLSLSWMPQLDKIVDIMQNGTTHPNFRLWLSSSPDPDFPIAILQNAIKMTTEPPEGLKTNMKRLYQNITKTQFSKCASQDKYKKLLFSLCFFHSILIERKKFQNLGWNVVYSFNDSDFEVSENLLSIYLDEYENTPWDALKYLIAGICYGGHVTDDWDRRLLNTYINQYFNEDAIITSDYKLSSVPEYYIPRNGDLQNYKNFIESLPIVDSPQVFGQHSNAEMASLMGTNRIICDTLMVLQGQSSSVTEENKEDKVLLLSSKILNKIPDQIDFEHTAKIIGTNRKPLDVVLLQEILRYNNLLEEIKMSLIGLEKGIKGLVVMSSDLEDVFQSVYEGKVPGQWLKTYPSLMNLGAWTQDLRKRVNHFAVWANTINPPVLFWLGAFTYPTGFLTAVLQIHSRNSSVPIDLLNWKFIPISTPEKDIETSPEEGVYVRNLYLEGADWNAKKSCLCEPVPLKFISALPIIQFKPVLSAPADSENIYQCPVYYYPQRCGSDGRNVFIVTMTFNGGLEPPDHWIKRATAVLLNLQN